MPLDDTDPSSPQEAGLVTPTFAPQTTIQDVSLASVEDARLTAAEKLRQEHAERAKNRSTFDLLTTGMLTRDILERPVSRYSPDKNFTFERYMERFKAAQDELPEEYWSSVRGAVSDEHFDALMAQARERIARTEDLAAQGLPLKLAHFAAGFLDPTTLALGLGTMAPVIKAAQIARAKNLGWIAAQAGAGALGGVAIEAVRQGEGNPVTGADYLTAAGYGMVLGGAFGAMSRNPAVSEEAAALTKAGRGLMDLAKAGAQKLPAKWRPSQASSDRAAVEAAGPKPTGHPEITVENVDPVAQREAQSVIDDILGREKAESVPDRAAFQDREEVLPYAVRNNDGTADGSNGRQLLNEGQVDEAMQWAVDNGRKDVADAIVANWEKQIARSRKSKFVPEKNRSPEEQAQSKVDHDANLDRLQQVTDNLRQWRDQEFGNKATAEPVAPESRPEPSSAESKPKVQLSRDRQELKDNAAAFLARRKELGGKVKEEPEGGRAALATVKPLPGKLGETPDGYTFRGNKYELDKESSYESDAQTVRVFRAHNSDGQDVGYVELTKNSEGRWRVSMIEVPPEHRKSSAAYGLLKVAQQEIEGQPIVPDGVLLKDGFAHWQDRLPWVKAWYRPLPENPASGTMISPKQIKEGLVLTALNLADNAKTATKQGLKRLNDRFAVYKKAWDELPAEAKTDENLAAMFAKRDPLAGKSFVFRDGLEAEVNEILDRMLPAGVKRYVRPEILENGGLDGLYKARAVWIALNADNPANIAYHESVHALRALGLFSAKEWGQLQKWAAKNKLAERYKIEERYGDDIRAEVGNNAEEYARIVEEEAIAHALADHVHNGVRFGTEDGLFARVKDFLRVLRDALHIKGFRTVNDVFEDFASGAISRRAEPTITPEGAFGRAAIPQGPGARTLPFLQDAAWQSIEQEHVPRTGKEKLRIDNAGVAAKTDNAAMRLVSDHLFNNSVGKQDHSVNPFSADQSMQRIYNQYMGEFDRYRGPALQEWGESQGLNAFQTQRRSHEFAEAVGQAVRDPNGVHGPYHPAVERFANEVRRIHKDALKLYQNPNYMPFSPQGAAQLPGRAINGATNVVESDSYIWRSLAAEKVRGLIERFGESGAVQLLTGAIHAAQPHIDPHYLTQLARGWVRNVFSRSVGVGDEFAAALGDGDRAQLAALLRQGGTLSEQEIDHILSQLHATAGDGARTTNLQSRVNLDENFTMPLTDNRGVTEQVSFRDILDNNVDNLFTGYLRRLSGWAALGRVKVRLPDQVGGDVLIDGITSRAEITDVIQKVKQWGADHVPNYDPAKDEEYLEWAFDRILGTPMPHAGKPYAKHVANIKAMNDMRLMNQVGIAQMGETGTLASSVGVKATTQHVPAYRRVITAAGENRVNHPMFAETEGVGIGTERLHGWSLRDHDEMAGNLPFETQPASGYDRFTNAMQTGRRATYELSLNSVIQERQEKWAAASMAQKFADMGARLRSGKRLRRGDLRRAAQLGIDEPMLRRIFDEMATHTTSVPSYFWNTKLESLNFNAWTDLEARMAMENAMFRHVRKMVQTSDMGSMATWMSDPMLGLFFQYRGFTFTAWGNQTLYNAHMADLAALQTFLWTTMWNSLVRGMQIQLLSVGRSDRDEYLEKNLTPWELGKAGFQRAGWSSLFPTIMDTGLLLTGQEAAFNARSSGQPSDLFFGSPVASFFSQGVKGIGAVADSFISDRQLSQGEVRNAFSVLPGMNAVPIAMGLNALISDLPERSHKRRHHD